MHPPPMLPDEDERLDAVAEYRSSGSFEQVDYAPLLELARGLFQVPTAFISLVGRDSQTFVARLGLDLCDTSREVSFCAHAIAQPDMLLVPDAALDPRFDDNPLVLGPPGIRFYVGLPLRNVAGQPVGTFCIADSRPRSDLPDMQRSWLRTLAAMVLDKLELRRLELARETGQARFENVAATSPDGIVCAGQDGLISFWNKSAERLFGYSAADAIGRSLDLIVPERLRGGHGGGIRRLVAGGRPRLVGQTVELLARRSSGAEFPVELSLSMWQDSEGPSFGAILRDISDRRQNEERLHRLAHHDPLTDLPNRVALRQRLARVVADATPASLFMLDLDGFKTVNDTLGHAAGDVVLREVARRLLEVVAGRDMVARLGGDEFAILLAGTADPGIAAGIADAVIQGVSRPIAALGQVVTIGASLGMALHPRDGTTLDELLSSADLALYHAKAEGRQCHRAFGPELRRTIDQARAFDIELRRAHEEGEFELHYQPQVRLSDGRLLGAEALLRWRHPTRGLLSPASFISALEVHPTSIDVGTWVLRAACETAASWQGRLDGFRIGVNLFGSQLRDGRLEETVRDVLAATGLPAASLELEITENILLRHDAAVMASLRALREDGVGIALDDYGTGFASLSMLKRTPISRLKVDQSFVRGLCGSREDAAIVRSILHLGRAFRFGVIAEGVETEEQRNWLRRRGCQEAQGYLYCRPMAADAFAARHGLSRIAA